MSKRTDGTAETTDMMDYPYPDNSGIWLRYAPKEPNLKYPRYVPFWFTPKPQETKGVE